MSALDLHWTRGYGLAMALILGGSQCTGQIDMDVAGEFTFDSPEHYTAIVTARSFMLGRLMQSIHTSVEGQRVGDCP